MRLLVVLLPLHNPARVILSILLLPLLRLHLILHLEWLRHIKSPFDSGSVVDFVKPRLHLTVSFVVSLTS